jgi:hypothetical protein
MNAAMLEEFFLAMDKQHHEIMGVSHHTCKVPSTHSTGPYSVSA